MELKNPPELTPEFFQQNPVLAICFTLFFGVLLLFFAGAITSWILILVRWWKQVPVIPVDAWSPRVWGLADVLLTLVSMVAVQFLAVALLVPQLGMDLDSMKEGGTTPLSLSALVSVSYLVTVVIVTLWLVLRYRVGIAHIGFTAHRLPQHLGLGLVAGLATLPFIYALSAAVSFGFDAEYKHPLLEAMKADGSLTSYLLACFTAVICAPLAEEFLFRVIVQGWLQSIPYSSLGAAVLGASQSHRGDPGDVLFFHPASERLEAGAIGSRVIPVEGPSGQDLLSSTGANPYQPPTLPLYNANSTDATLPPTLIPPVWPAIVTGILFGLAHWGYGLSFVPLIAFGIVLGLVYRATQSIWPCVLIHCMLNASSMLALGVNVLLMRATQ